MVESSKWIATIPTPSLANNCKIDIVNELLIPYSDLMSYFLSDIDVRFVRDKEQLLFTNAKPYQTQKDYKRLFESCKKRYKSQLEKGQIPKQTLTVRCQVQEASKECHRHYCHDNGLMTYQESLAKGSL